MYEFINAVNRSYEHYERDHLLGKQSLEISSVELHQLMDDLIGKESYLFAILQAASDGILVVNEKDEIEICNPLAVKYLGYDTEKGLLGKNISQMQVFQLHQSEPSTLSDFFHQKKSQNLYEIYIQKKPHLIFELSISKFKYIEQLYSICILRDISQRKESEKKIEVRHSVTRLLFSESSIEAAAPKIIATLCNDLRWDLGFFWIKEDSYLKPLCYFDRTKDLSSSKFVSKTIGDDYLKSDKIILKLLEKKEPHFSCDVMTSPDYLRKDEASLCGLKYCVVVPFVAEDQVFGFIELFTERECLEDFEMKKVFQDIGSEIGMYFMHLQVQQRAQNLHKQLVLSARQAGIAQVSSSVLHNVGNALNTLNISANLLQENYQSSQLHDLPKIADLIRKNKNNLSSFVLENPKGMQIFDYIVAFSDWWQKDQESIQNQLNFFSKNIQHIKHIIETQQSIANPLALKEKFSINLLLDDLLAIFKKNLESGGIQVIKDFQYIPEAMLDRSLIVQILENLLGNAIDALEAKKENDKNLTLHTQMLDPNTIQITIKDDGVGIDPENNLKIFSYGFTTKPGGHGFGLHNSALLAKELGGNLSVESNGINQGAIFFLTIPIN